MKAHKRYGCHRVYDGYKHYHPQSVVTISEKGEVLSCTPLTNEIPFTEWIGGVIVLSPLSEAVPDADMKTLLGKTTTPCRTPLYAWHISNFDFTKEKPAPQSLIRRL